MITRDSVEVDGKCYSVAWLSPGCIPLFIGANLYNNYTNAKEDKPEGLNAWDYTWEAIKAASGYIEPMLELSMLSSFDDALKAYSSAENPMEGGLAGFLTAATNYVTQGFPTVFGQWEKATEEYKSTTYINTANPFERTIKQALASASQRIPGIDLYQTAAIDKWGQPIKNGDSKLEWAINATLNPTNISEISSDPVDLEIDRLSKAQKDDVTAPYFRKVISYTDKDGIEHDNVRLTAEQWDQLARKEGTTRHDLISQMMESKDYKAMTDEQKAKAVSLAYAYSRETAELDLFKDHEGYSASWMTDASHRKTSAYILNRVLDSDIGHAMTELTTGWKNGHAKSVTDRWAAELDTAYTSYSKMSEAAKKEVQDFATGDAARYIEARDNGVSHVDAVNTMRLIASLKPETGNKEVHDIQKYEAIAKSPTLNSKEKDSLILAYMDDYDPTAKSPITTELKYQYARQEMGLTPEQYIRALRANVGKKEEKKAAWRDMGFTSAEADILYRLLYATGATKINTASWYNNK